MRIVLSLFSSHLSPVMSSAHLPLYIVQFWEEASGTEGNCVEPSNHCTAIDNLPVMRTTHHLLSSNCVILECVILQKFFV